MVSRIPKVSIKKRVQVEILKASSDELRLVFGRALICTKNGKPYFDTQGDHVPDATMMRETADYMEKSGAVNEMHEGGDVGGVVFSMPWTPEVAKAFGLKDANPKDAWTGWMVGARLDAASYAKVKAGKLRSFSIEGERLEEEVVEE